MPLRQSNVAVTAALVSLKGAEIKSRIGSSRTKDPGMS